MITSRGIVWSLFAIVAVAAAFLASLSFGIRVINPFAAFLGTGDPLERVLLESARFPRATIAVSVGVGLGLAGAILQTVTRNVLADPGLLGINAGAAFGVVVMLSLVDSAPPLSVLGGVAVAAAAATGLLAYILAGGHRAFEAQPLRLVLSGGVLAIGLGSLTQVVLLLSPGALEASQIWLAGSFADRPASMLYAYGLPLAGLAISAFVLSRPLMILAVGDVQARALGVNAGRLKLVSLGLAAGICGLAVSLAGPIAFIGLIAPHIGRAVGGQNLLAVFAIAAAAGAVLALIADVGARLFVAPGELPVGLIIAAAGVPFYLILLRRGVQI